VRRAAALNAPFGHIAYKTGTSYGYRDAFAIGFDKAHTIAVWLGGQTMARCSASPDAKPPRRYCSTLSQGSAPGTNSLPRPPVFSRAGPASLPPPLRHLRKDVPTILAAVATAQLKIAFPPDGARVDLGLTLPPPQGPQPRARLALKAEGGVLPLRWIVNGTPVEGPDLRRQAAWTPDGAGFARVSVVDARGATDSVLVRLE
jgi:penicillin-binding protein 1C